MQTPIILKFAFSATNPSVHSASTLHSPKMKSFVAVLAIAAMATADAATCATSVLSQLLSDQYIDQCGTDSGYAFTSGVKPTETEALAMCASDACHGLLADAQAMGLTECTIPLGDKINLLADLINYVPTFCTSGSGSTTEAPTTDSPSTTTATPSTTTATPSTTTATPAAC